VILKKLINAVAPSAQPFRGAGRGSPTARTTSKAGTTASASASSRSGGWGPNACAQGRLGLVQRC
jgi:hypothetical protein